MTQEHPITPPPELVRDWAQKAQLLSGDDPVSFAELLCNKAARWGADQELAACCEVLTRELICDGKHVATDLRNVRRPKPPSLKEQALDELQLSFGRGYLKKEGADTIRRALESLPD